MSDAKSLANDLSELAKLQDVRLLEAQRLAREAAETRSRKEDARTEACGDVETAVREWEEVLAGEAFDPAWLPRIAGQIAHSEAKLDAADADLELAKAHETARRKQVRLYSVHLDHLNAEAGRSKGRARRQADAKRDENMLDIHHLRTRGDAT